MFLLLYDRRKSSESQHHGDTYIANKSELQLHVHRPGAPDELCLFINLRLDEYTSDGDARARVYLLAICSRRGLSNDVRELRVCVSPH